MYLDGPIIHSIYIKSLKIAANNMPLIMIDWTEDRSLEQKREIMKEITEVV